MQNVITIRLQDKKFSIDVNKYKIESISIFGSHIHGDADDKSDIDLLIIVENMSQRQRANARRRIAVDMKVPFTWLTLYTKKELEQNCKKGDYYFWYLRIVRKAVYERTSYTRDTFSVMPVYTDVRGTLHSCNRDIEETMRDVARGKDSYEKAMNNIAHSLRAVFIEICYMHRFILFDKTKPVKACFALKDVKIPFSYNEYIELYELKREYKFDPNFVLSGNKKDYVYKWYKNFKLLYQEALRLCKMKMNGHFISPLMQYK